MGGLVENNEPLFFITNYSKSRGQRAEGRREKVDGSWFQYLALS
jgi:hypothetical protein